MTGIMSELVIRSGLFGDDDDDDGEDQEVGVVITGLKNAGKSTILKKINFGPVSNQTSEIERVVYVPKHKAKTCAQLCSCKKAKRSALIFSAFDCGTNIPKFDKAKGLIFVVDSTDPDRFAEAKDQLHKLMEDVQFKDATLLVFCNKQDFEDSWPSSSIVDVLELDHLRGRNWYIQPSVATYGDGLYDGLAWLFQIMAERESRSGNQI